MNALSSKRLIFVGAGNVATNLAIAFHKKGFKIVQIYSRTLSSARKLAEKIGVGFTDNISQVEKADIYFVCITDSAIKTIISQPRWQNTIILHTAGSIPMDVLMPATSHYGVFYPLQTFSKTRIIDMDEVPLCIEAGDEETLVTLKELASLISKNVYVINSEQRMALHLAAVFSCNFTNHLYAISECVLRDKNINFELLYPLIRETIEKIQGMPPSKAQTGPAVRKDMTIVKKHVEILAEYPEYQNIYKVLSNSIIKLNSGNNKY